MILGWLPADVSTFGPNIDSTLKLIVYIVGTAFILAEGTLLAFVILYRRRAGGRASFVRGESLRELAWVLIPVLVVTLLDVAMRSSTDGCSRIRAPTASSARTTTWSNKRL
jgi:heme/copper-type cytochrome/quinol oxidase subunit 2